MGECLIIRSGGGTDTSGATATASVVLAGYTCYVNDNKITGSMPAQTLNRTLNAGGSVTIPAGYYDGSSVISTSTLAGETAANAASSHILSGYNAWVNGSKINGSMVNRGNISHSLPANGSYTIPAGWHAGGGVVNQSLAFHWGGTYTPNTANQVICWANWYAAGNIVVAGNGNLVAGNIRNGITIFGILGTYVGWVDSTMDYFTWHNYLTWTTNRIGEQIWFNSAEDSFVVFEARIPASTYDWYWERSNAPTTTFRAIQINLDAWANSQSASIWFRVEIGYVWYSQFYSNWQYKLFRNHIDTSAASYVTDSAYIAQLSFTTNYAWLHNTFSNEIPTHATIRWDTLDSFANGQLLDYYWTTTFPSRVSVDGYARPTTVEVSMVRSNRLVTNGYGQLNGFSMIYVK